nr:NAD-glutamate dehydrogenase domain-containing protein [Nocardioides sambongensis]
MAREIFGSLALRKELATFDNVLDAGVQTRMRVEMRTLVERASRWLVTNRRPPLDSQATVDLFSGPVQRTLLELPDLLIGRELQAHAARRSSWEEQGVPEDLAARVASFDVGYALLNVVEIATRDGLEPFEVARVHFALGERLALAVLQQRIVALPRLDQWQTMARAALRDDLHAVHAQLTGQVLAATDPDRSATERVEQWIEEAGGIVDQAESTLRAVCAEDRVDLARTSVGLRVVRSLLA